MELTEGVRILWQISIQVTDIFLCVKNRKNNTSKYKKMQSNSFIHSIIHSYSALEVGLAGTRAQSCDWYDSGTLHPGQVLGGSLPMLSPAFRRSHFRRQVPVRPQRRERS